MVSRDRAKAEGIELAVAPDNPFRIRGALLRRARSAVRVREVKEDRTALENLDAVVVGQEGHLLERMV